MTNRPTYPPADPREVYDEGGLDSGLLERYWHRETSPEETASVDAWFDAHPGEWARYEQLRRGLGGRVRVDITQREVDRTLAAVMFATARPSVAPQPADRPRQWIAWGLGATLLAFGAIMMMHRITPVPFARGARATTYTTHTGQRSTVTLSDGSRVTLAPQTILEVEPEFGKKSRTISLNGEAYFDVAQSSGAPFIVRTNNIRTTVLGTTFAVRHYHNDATTRVAVVGGKVAVSGPRSNRNAVTLVGGNTADVTDSTATVRLDSDAAQYAAWTNGRLIFRDAPAIDVLTTMSRWYGYQFRLADSTLADVKLNAHISTESPRDALTTLKLVLDVTLTFDGNVVTLHPRGKDRARPRDAQTLRNIISSPKNEVGR